MNICLCGSEAGYPHAHDCPRPLFRCGEAEEARWLAERERLRRLNADAEAAGLLVLGGEGGDGS